MRRIGLLILIALLAAPSVSLAGIVRNKVVRCGWSFGFALGPAVHTDMELKDEFNVPFDFEAEAKYYLWKPFSLAAALGTYYGEGNPEDLEWHGDWMDFDRDGVSFWRAYYLNLLARVEIGRYWIFNPYIGGGSGIVYNSLWRKGPVNAEPYSDSYMEWIVDYVGLIGFDVAVNEFVAIKLEGRWSFIPSQDTFTEKKDIGTWAGLLGFQIYL